MRICARYPLFHWGWLCCVVLLLTACGGVGGETTALAEEEEKTAQVTVWSEPFEIFLEHRLPVVGVPVTFTTHVTDLHTLEPRRSGPLTVVLRQSETDSLTQTVHAPARDGIYLPVLTFPRPGVWHVAFRIPMAEQEHVVDLLPLTVFATPAEASSAPTSVAPEGISFLKEQQWKLRTQTVPVVRGQMVERLRLSGVVAVRPGHSAAVMPPLPGHLVAPPGSTLPSLGVQVQAGQVLALVQPRLAGSDILTLLSTQQQVHALEVELTVKAAAAEAEAIRARAALTQAEHVLRRMRILREQNARSARELEEAEFAQRKAEADLSAAEALRKTYDKAKKHLEERPRILEQGSELPAVALKAPITGTVVAVRAALGEHVHTETAVFTLLNTETVFLEAHLPEADLNRLGTSYRATYETMARPGVVMPILGREGKGRLVALGLSVEAKTRTLPLVYEVPNPAGHLRIGMALTIYVETAQAVDAVIVPLTALVEEDGRAVAFVQAAGETFHKRDLTLGIQDGEFVQVLAGLAPGERVVTQGAYAIRLASVSTTIPAHGHAH